MEFAQIPWLKKKKKTKASYRGHAKDKKHRPIRFLSPSVFQIVVDFLPFRVITVAINSLT